MLGRTRNIRPLLLICLSIFTVGIPCIGQAIETEIQKLLASDGATGDQFGYSMAIDGNTVVIGNLGRPEQPGVSSGAAYVFAKVDDEWVQQGPPLTPEDDITNEGYGHAVAINGDTVVVGHYGNSELGTFAGAAYVFVRTDGIWSQEQKIISSDGVARDKFGTGVAIEGDTIIVGAPDAEYEGSARKPGVAYVFTRTDGVWSEHQKLIHTQASSDDAFGRSVSISGDTVVFTGSLHNLKGAVVFTRIGGDWSQETILLPDDAFDSWKLAYSAEVVGDTVLAMSLRSVTGDQTLSAAYVFKRIEGVWIQQEKLLPTVETDSGTSLFVNVRSVALANNIAVLGVGLNQNTTLRDGAGISFIQTNGEWLQDKVMQASDGEANDLFGGAVAVDGNEVFVGAHGDSDLVAYAGAAYVFESGYSRFSITHDDYLVVDFVLPIPPVSGADTLTLGFWDGGIGPSVVPTDTGGFWNGTEPLGTSSNVPACIGPLAWKSAISNYSSSCSEVSVIDFSSVEDGSVEGQIVFQPGLGRSMEVDPLAAVGEPYSIALSLGTGLPDEGLTNINGGEQPIIESVTVIPVSTEIPSLQLSASSIAFGSVGVGNSLTETIIIESTGTADLIIGALDLSGHTSEFDVINDGCSNTTVSPGFDCSFDIEFAPASTGVKSGAISIPSNTVDSPHTVSVGGEGVELTPILNLSSDLLSFPDQIVDTASSSKSVTVTNVGTADLQIGTVTTTGLGTDSYVLDAVDCSGAILGSGDHCVLSAVFEPDTVGTHQANIQIPSNDDSGPHAVQLEGDGVILSPEILLSVDELHFSDQYVGSTSLSQDVTISNTGSANLEIDTITMSGLNADNFEFADDACSSVTLSPSSQCVLSISFSPTADGQRIGTALISSNFSGSPSSIGIDGNGVQPVMKSCKNLITKKFSSVCKMLANLRSDSYFGIPYSGVTDERLLDYIKANKNDIELLLLKVDFGRGVDGYVFKGARGFASQEEYLDSIKSAKDAAEILEYMIQFFRIVTQDPDALVFTSTYAQAMSTIIQGYRIYKLAKPLIAEKETRVLLREYMADRRSGASPEQAWLNTIWGLEPIVDLISATWDIPVDYLDDWFEHAYATYSMVGYPESLHVRIAQGEVIAELANAD